MTTVDERIEMALNIAEGFKGQVDGKQLADLLVHLSEVQAMLKKLPIHDVSGLSVGDSVFCEDDQEKCLHKGEYNVIEVVSSNEVILNRIDDPDNFPRINPNKDYIFKRHYR